MVYYFYSKVQPCCPEHYQKHSPAGRNINIGTLLSIITMGGKMVEMNTLMDMPQLERIKKMEACMDTASAAVRNLETALEQYEQAYEALAELSEYYGSLIWMEDHEADEAGELPEDLKRGVLSEDLLWNLLADNREAAGKMMRILARSMEKKII